MTDPPDNLLATRQSLLRRMRNLDDQASWQTFFDTYWRLIYNVARRAGLTDNEAQDAVQETVIAVARQMPEFRYDPEVGSFRGWLMKITHRRVADQVRKKVYERDGRKLPREEPLGTALLENLADAGGSDWENTWNEEWEKHVLGAALEAVKRRVSPGQYQMFFLHVFKGLPARTVARRLSAKLMDVYFAKYKVSALLKKEVQALERKMN